MEDQKLARQCRAVCPGARIAAMVAGSFIESDRLRKPHAPKALRAAEAEQVEVFVSARRCFCGGAEVEPLDEVVGALHDVAEAGTAEETQADLIRGGTGDFGDSRAE